MTEPDGSPKLPSAKFFFSPLSRNKRHENRREERGLKAGVRRIHERRLLTSLTTEREQRKQERKERTQKKSSKLGERGFSGRGDGDRENRKGGKGNNLDLRLGRPLHVDAKSD